MSGARTTIRTPSRVGSRFLLLEAYTDLKRGTYYGALGCHGTEDRTFCPGGSTPFALAAHIQRKATKAAISNAPRRTKKDAAATAGLGDAGMAAALQATKTRQRKKGRTHVRPGAS